MLTIYMIWSEGSWKDPMWGRSGKAADLYTTEAALSVGEME